MHTTRRFVAVTFAAALMLVSTAGPVGAITNGQPDGNVHPMVGELFFYVPDAIDPRFSDPGAWYSCSGTLISPTVVVTAGHCTWAIGLDGVETTSTGGDGGNDIWINFNEEPDFTGIPPSGDYIPDRNQERYEDRVDWFASEPAWYRGVAHPHPDYIDAAFYLYDAGVVVLDRPVTGVTTYGQLPAEDYLEQFRATRRNDQRFTPVGYGLEKVLPIGVEGGDTRMFSDVKLNDLTSGRDVYAIFSNNNGKAHQGGTCYGDSGGPIFDKGTMIMVAVTSFGISPNCTGIGGGYRLDQPDDLAFINSFLP